MVIEQVLLNPTQLLSGIEIITAEEKRQILEEFNHTPVPYPQAKTLHRLFADQVEQIPDYIALVGSHESHYEGTRGLAPLSTPISITYKQLNQKSNQLAGVLIERGVKPDTIVGIMADRSVGMIIGILGTLKAGGAYLPIDPDYPEERINYMLTDSNTKFLVTTRGLSEKFKKLLIVNCQLLIVNERPPNRRRLNNPPKEANSVNNYQLTINNLQLKWTNLAYIIYTSGSTGKPKGVPVEHVSVVNVLTTLSKKYPGYLSIKNFLHL